ncbi:MAG: TIGR02147 family protein [Proteobacteria bacterium]|nr:TIGR02147 family protein [Pseudomonadota bacterium]
MKQRPSVYSYTNYRSYLQDFYLFMKQSKRGYSYRQFSQSAGFSSPNVLKLAIESNRNISNKSVDKFIKALSLGPGPAEYFRCLVLMNQADQDEQRVEYFTKLKRLIPSSRRYELQAEAVEYLSHWIFPVIREMVLLEGFRDDPYWIQRRLTGRIELKQIVSALNFLKSNGFIEKLANGTYSVKDEIVITSDEVKNLAVRAFHRRILLQAIEAIEDLPVEQREYGALIFQLPETAIPELKQKLKSFRQELHKWALEQTQSQKNKTVIQLNLQMFPQTKGAES